MSTLDPHGLVKEVAEQKRPYLLMALRQDMAKAYGDKQPREEAVLLHELQEVESKLAMLSAANPLTQRERFMVQYLQTQSAASQMRQDGDEYLGLDMDKVDALSTEELEAIKQEAEQGEAKAKVIDIRDRLPKHVEAHEDAAASDEVPEEEFYSVREFQLRMFDFVDLYHQLREEQRLLLQYEGERERLVRQLRRSGVSGAEIESLYTLTHTPAPVLDQPKLGSMEKYDYRQRDLFRVLKQVHDKREEMVAKLRQRMDNLDRFYRDNLTLEQKLKLKARLQRASLSPALAPQLKLQNVLKFAPQPAPAPGMRPQPGRGKRPEEHLQPRPPRPRPPSPL